MASPGSVIMAFESASVPASPASLSQGVSVIIATLDDAEVVDLLLDRLVDQLSHRIQYEIVVMDLGSSDDTCELVSHWTATHPVTLIQGCSVSDFAGSLCAAASVARHPVLLIFAADQSAPKSMMEELTEPVLSGAFDIVFGTRCNKGQIQRPKASKKALDRLGKLLAWPYGPDGSRMSYAIAMRRSYLLAQDCLWANPAQSHLNERVLELPLLHSGSQPDSEGAGAMGATRVSILHEIADYRALPRFLSVGIAGFILDFSLVWGFLALGLHTVPAFLSGFVCSSAFTYLAHAEWTFKSRSVSRFQFIRYIVLLVTALSARAATVFALSGCGFQEEFVIAAGILGGGILSYLGSRSLVFRGDVEAIYKTK